MTDARLDFAQLTAEQQPPDPPESALSCYICFGPADRLIAGRRGGPHIADCEKCRQGGIACTNTPQS